MSMCQKSCTASTRGLKGTHLSAAPSCRPLCTPFTSIKSHRVGPVTCHQQTPPCMHAPKLSDDMFILQMSAQQVQQQAGVQANTRQADRGVLIQLAVSNPLQVPYTCCLDYTTAGPHVSRFN
jgi:hypothetical protein